MRNDDPFARFAAAGLAILFGLQSAINMAVNLHLMPAKGMTLPFISYGGSSMIALAYGMGMLLALTRERRAAAPSSMRDRRSSRERGAAPMRSDGVHAMRRADSARSCSPPAAPADICFPAEALARADQARLSRVDSRPTTRARATADFPAERRSTSPERDLRAAAIRSRLRDRRSLLGARHAQAVGLIARA